MVVVVVVVVVVLTSARIIKSVITAQAPVTLEMTNTPGQKHKHTGICVGSVCCLVFAQPKPFISLAVWIGLS